MKLFSGDGMYEILLSLRSTVLLFTAKRSVTLVWYENTEKKNTCSGHVAGQKKSAKNEDFGP